MKALNRSIDRFCARHPNFGISNLMLYIVIGNAVAYIISMMDTSGQQLFLYYLALFPERVLKGEVWRLVTFVLVPDSSNLLYLALFMYFYYFIGHTLEAEWGKGRFLIYYLLGMLLTILCAFGIYLFGLSVGVYGATFLNLSMFFAYATLYPENRVLFMLFIPIKIKWLAFVNAGFFLLEIITMGFPEGLFPIVAVLNYFLFCGDTLLGYFSRLRYRASPKVVKFNRVRREASRNFQEGKGPYERRCAVCGKTEAEHPELEFRYCSRCSGYHCFCQDHINTHIHFTD